MQRRAAAIYVVFFVVVGAASYSLIATAHTPSIEFDNPEYSLSQGDTPTIGGTQYNVSSLEASSGGGGGGGHGGGGGGGVERSGTITWVNESAQYSETWQNNSTVTLQNTTYRVLMPNESNPSAFTLQDEVNESQVLQNDPQADDQTVTRNGSEYVVIEDENGTRLVPASEYFPDPTNRTVNEGQTLNYNGNQTTVANVTNQSAVLEWTAPRTNTVEFADNENVTLGGTTYLAHFPDNETVALTTDFESYDSQTAEIDRYHEYIDGLWGVSIISSLAAILLAGMAYLPSRY